MPGGTPPLSVVVTTYRRAHELPRTLDSILAQRFGDFGFIVSDDASPDDTEAVVREYERRDPRIRYRRNAANLNMPGNLNAALREARAPLVANLHDGDVYRPDLLARWKAALDEQADAAFVFNGCAFLDGEGRIVRRTRHTFRPRIEARELVAYFLGRLSGEAEEATVALGVDDVALRATLPGRIARFFVGPFDSPVWGTVMARRAAYDAAGWFNPRYGFISDVEMWMRLNLEHPVAYIEEPLIALAPCGTDRPHSFISWRIERSLMGMFEDCIDRAYGADPARVARFRRLLRKARDRRWIWLANECLRHGRTDLFLEAARMFRAEDSLELRAAGLLGAAVGLLPRGRADVQ